MLRNLLYAADDNGDDSVDVAGGRSPPPLLFLAHALDVIGAPSIPLAIITLGGQLALANPRKAKLSVVLKVSAFRLVVMPALGALCGFVFMAIGFTDKIALFTLMM